MDFLTLKCGVKINKSSPLHAECMALVMALDEEIPLATLVNSYHQALRIKRPDHAAVFLAALEWRNPLRPPVEYARA